MRFAAVLAALIASTAVAQPVAAPPPDARVVLNTFTVIRANPIGLDLQGTLGYRKRIGDSEELLWKSRHYSLNAMATINPANATLQAFAVVEPIAVFQLKVGAEYRQFFGILGNLLSSADPDMAVNAPDLKLLEAGQYASYGYNFYAEPVLQAKVGPVAIRNAFNVGYRGVGLRAGDTTYYDPALDLRLPGSGVLIQNTAMALYIAERWVAGLRYDLHNPLNYANNDVHRAGFLAAYTFWDNGPSMWNKGTVLAMAHWPLKHPAGASRGAVPTFVVGFSTESDLFR